MYHGKNSSIDFGLDTKFHSYHAELAKYVYGYNLGLIFTA